MIYAPGFYTGYGVTTIPSVREAIEQRNWTEAGIEIPKVAATLDRLSDSIAKAQTLLKK
jgi:N-acetylated-alpha-linked acidic dipeptidase